MQPEYTVKKNPVKEGKQDLPPLQLNIIDELTAKLLRPRHPTNVSKVLHTFARDNHLRVNTLDHKVKHIRRLKATSKDKEQTFKEVQLEEKLWAAQLKREERIRKELRDAQVRIQWRSFP